MDEAASTSPAAKLPNWCKRRFTSRTVGEGAMSAVSVAAAAISIVTTFSIIAILLREALEFFHKVSPVAFFTGAKWSPQFQDPQYGVLPLMAGTFQIALGAAVIALPIGLFAAIFLAEFASPRVRNLLKPALEILAGVPTVVYGYFGLITITPILRSISPKIEVFNMLSGAIVVGIMILPLVSSLCEDALSAVPKSLREAAYGLGATKFEVTTQVVVPAALSGIMSSFVLAISRAVGETMAVTLAAGMTPKLTLNIGESIQTMTSFIVQVSLGDTPEGSITYQTIFAVGLTLFAITFLMNLFARRMVVRFRSVYQ